MQRPLSVSMGEQTGFSLYGPRTDSVNSKAQTCFMRHSQIVVMGLTQIVFMFAFHNSDVQVSRGSVCFRG